MRYATVLQRNFFAAILKRILYGPCLKSYPFTYTKCTGVKLPRHLELSAEGCPWDLPRLGDGSFRNNASLFCCAFISVLNMWIVAALCFAGLLLAPAC